MTLRELSKRLKSHQNESDKVREMIADAGISEFTVYSPPTARWMQILQDLGLSSLSGAAVCVTCYNSDDTAFEAIETQLKKRYKAVTSATVDELGYRKLFGCGDSADKPPQLILCANYYEASREEVKNMYNSEDASNNADANDANDDGTELQLEEDDDPFA